MKTLHSNQSLPKVLVVEDEPSIRDTIVYALESEGYQVEWKATGNEALDVLLRSHYALLVLDVGLPDISGFDVCRELRKTSHVPIIFLTARASEVDRVVGLEIGADDYVTKPFSPRELTARVRANIRRSKLHHTPKEPQNQGKPTPFIVDKERWTISYHDEVITLSRYEFRLLAALVGKPGKVFSRTELMNLAWDEPDASMERTVDSHIKSVRAKLKSVNKEVDPIVTHRGVGYSLMEEW